MQLNEVIAQTYDPVSDSFTGAITLPETLTTPATKTFDPTNVRGIQVWNRGLCRILQHEVAGSWHVYLLQESGAEPHEHVMAYNVATRQWLHVAADFDYVPIPVAGKKPRVMTVQPVEKSRIPSWVPSFIRNLFE